MWIYTMLFCASLSIFISMLFYLLSKLEKWDSMLSSSFECGFMSYFYSRYSFSVHYYLIGLIFLFLDLELCVIMPYFNNFNKDFMIINILLFFIVILILGLIKEWIDDKLVWFE